MHTVLDNAFDQLKLEEDSTFHPRKGFEHTRSSETWDFYVVTRGRVPGIYTHWRVFHLFNSEDAFIQVDKFRGHAHKKYRGWSSATSAFDNARRPSGYDVNFRPPSAPTPSTPPRPLVVRDKKPVVALTPTQPRQPGDVPSASRSAPATPTGSRKNLLYVYSRGKDTTIYADQHQVSTAARRGLADGSFRKVEVTSGEQEEARQKHVFSRIVRPLPKAFKCCRAGKLTADRRRADIRVVPIQRERAPVPPSPAPEDDWVDMQVDDEPPADSRPPRKRKWYATTDDNLRHWVANYRDEYLRVLVTREGSWARKSSCSCGQPASYRDIDFVPFVASRPGMAPSSTAGTYASSACGCSLVTLTTDDALTLTRGGEKFVVIAPNGFHSVAVDFCQCRRSGSQSHWEQLLSHGWYPATPDNPQSAITIAALKLFHAVSLQGKTTTYHFFNALAKITDNTGSNTFKSRYQLALRVVRQWRNLRALKRGGMGNDPDRRTAETRDGELAVDCLACPKAGVNLPEGWEKAPISVLHLLCDRRMFRLKRKKISSWLADPSIQDGWAYFTCSGPYMEFVETLGEQKEMSTCTGLAALDHANTKYAQGYAATGCAGEKYGNMDYIVASAWRHLRDLLFFLLSERLLKLPPALRFQLARYFVKFVIPKLHILGHLKFCQDFFSLLYTLGSAQADMEGIERIWSSSGLMGASTREMGPGSRQDTLDDFWHYWNWNKVVGMGKTLRTRLLAARKELAQQEEGLEEFTAAQEAEAPAWKQMVDDFEAGVSEANPKNASVALPPVLNTADDTATEYLMLGLEIEGQQRQLAADLLAKRNPTSKELTDFVARRTRVSRQIKKLRLMQRIYSPGALQRLATTADPVEPGAAALRFRPSHLPRRDFVTGNCSESLEAIRHGLTIKNVCRRIKPSTPAASTRNTRSRTLVDGAHGAPGARPRCGACSWRALEKGDLRLPEDEEEAKRRKQRAMKGKRKEAAQVNENGEGTRRAWWGEAIHESVRVEWSKTQLVGMNVRLSMHYNGRIQYSAAHLQGAMALAARQAALRRKLAGPLPSFLCRLTDRVSPPQMEDSGQSSSERGDGDGDRDGDGDEEGPVAQVIDPGEARGQAVESEEGEGGGGGGGGRGPEGEGVGGEDAERRRAEMYDEV
ncbi:hypothetical protein B0H14DRAFT_3471764 [Mycena olivaceomarginata]|nr:hypothetical protein B0H14DRAFT_3471764 [Mycena olivaceomarginata]